MNYQEFIDNILHTRGRFACGNEYHEQHHIIPRCKNGSNDESNLIDLFAREHFIVHKLLFIENPDDAQLAHAYTLMAFTKDNAQQRYELTSEEYEEARKVYADKFSGEKNPSARKVIRLADDQLYQTVRECAYKNSISNYTMLTRLKQHRDFMYYDEWTNLTDIERYQNKTVDWREIEHNHRSQAAKKSGVGGSIKCSLETRKKISEAHKNKNGKQIYCPELHEEFNSISAASNKYGVNAVSIGYCLCAKQKHAGKHPITGEPLSWVQLENKIS